MVCHPLYAKKPLDIIESMTENFGTRLSTLFDEMVMHDAHPEDWPLPLLVSLHDLSVLLLEPAMEKVQRLRRARDQIQQLCFVRAERVGDPGSVAEMKAAIMQSMDVESAIGDVVKEDARETKKSKDKQKEAIPRGDPQGSASNGQSMAAHPGLTVATELPRLMVQQRPGSKNPIQSTPPRGPSLSPQSRRQGVREVYESLFAGEPVDKMERRRRAVLRKRAIRDTNLDLEDLEVKIEGVGHEAMDVQGKCDLKYQHTNKKRKLLELQDEEGDYVEFWGIDDEEEERPGKKMRLEGQNAGI